MALDVKRMQSLLGVAQDGDDGPATYTALFRKLGAPAVNAPALGLSASVNFARYDMREALRIIHFLGQCGLESGGFLYMREIWGPTPTQLRYEGRLDLGNTQPGDGKRYMGRSPIQVTGRANYRRAARKMGVDVEAQPELLERPDMGLWASCIWWADNDANRWADLNDGTAVSRLVNRGNARAEKAANHEADRAIWTARVRRLVLG